MSYYGAGDYYVGGDYYAAGGIGGFLGGILGGIGSVIPGPVGTVAKLAGGVLKGGKPKPQQGPLVVETPVPGIRGAAQRLVPGGASGYTYSVAARKRRRMNVANPKALRKAIRRQSGFVKLARRALQGTGYTITTRGRKQRPVSIRESGAGSVIVR